jgi:FtsH-binding integral membrane protein
MRLRVGLGAVGVLLGLYGGWLVVSRQDAAGILDLGLWLVGGVVVHDAVIAPLVLLLALAARRLPAAHRRATAVALVVTGSLSLLAVPVLTRLGARPDNPTLLDRPYLWSWAALLVLTAAVVVLVGRRGTRETSGSGGQGSDPAPAGPDAS